MSTRRFRMRSVDDVARTVAEARLQRGLTQDELADRVGISRTYLARLEAGGSTIQLQRILLLLRELGVDVEGRMEIDGPTT